MKTLIVYDSLYGNTEKVARAIGDTLKANAVHVSKILPDDLKGLDLLIVGSPTHGGRPSQSMKSFLDTLPGNSLVKTKVAAFDTGISPDGQNGFLKFIINFFGYASKRIDATLNAKGGKSAVKPETFFVKSKEGPLNDGEIERAKSWAKELV